MRAEVLVALLCLSASAFAQARRGGVPELAVPQFTAPRDGAFEVGTAVRATGHAQPLVDVVLFDADGTRLTVVQADEEGHWAASVSRPRGPTQLVARVFFVNQWSNASAVHFTMLRDDDVEGGGCSAGGGTLLLGAALLLRRRR